MRKGEDRRKETDPVRIDTSSSQPGVKLGVDTTVEKC